MAAKIPILRESENLEDTSPTTVGPVAHPTSPARAKKEYIMVPPPGSAEAARENVPGQNIPTENPMIAHPASEIIG